MYFPQRTKLRLADAETSYVYVCKKYLTELQKFCGPYLQIEFTDTIEQVKLYLQTIDGRIELKNNDIIVKTDLTISGKSEQEQLKVYSSQQFGELYYSDNEYRNINNTWDDENASEPIENEEVKCGCKDCNKCTYNSGLSKIVKNIIITPNNDLTEEEKAQFQNSVSKILKIVQN